MGREFCEMLTDVRGLIKDLEDKVISEKQPSQRTWPLSLPSSFQRDRETPGNIAGAQFLAHAGGHLSVAGPPWARYLSA